MSFSAALRHCLILTKGTALIGAQRTRAHLATNAFAL